MNVGDIIKIRNSAGLLSISLDKRLSIKDVMRGCGEDALGTFENCRWEFHKSKYGSTICTLYDHKKDNNNNIFVAFVSDFDPIDIWKAHFNEPEKDENIFETICE